MAGPTKTLDLSGQWVHFHNTQAITITNPDGTTCSVANALKREVPQSQLAGGPGNIVVPAFTARWHVWTGQTGTFVPQRNGYITDPQGYKWYIDDVEMVTLESRFAMRCTLEADVGLQ